MHFFKVKLRLPYTSDKMNLGDDMYDVGIIGCGPAGIFAALEILKNKPQTKIIMFDKGNNIKIRKCPKSITNKCIFCKPCNISCGFGGAGAFSDGKITLSKDVGGYLEEYIGEKVLNEYIQYVDDIYVSFGGDKEVEFDEKFAEEMYKKCKENNLDFIKCPIRHLGTEKCVEIMTKMYEKLTNYKNVTILANTEILDVEMKEKTIITSKEKYKCKNIILAVGRSGSSWLQNICKNQNIELLNNKVDIGVRVELPRKITDPITNHLYEFKVYNYSKTTQNVVRTFCMSPGGYVTQENYDNDLVCVNGHSFKENKSELTNFALLVSAHFTEPFKEPTKYGEHIARLANMLTDGKVMVQRLYDLKLAKRSTREKLKELTYEPTLKDAEPGDLSFALPGRILNAILETFDALEKICPGISGKETILYGVEVKFYSAKVKVNNNLQTNIKNIYAIGDGAGITRGLLQASISGVIAAKDIIKNL